MTGRPHGLTRVLLAHARRRLGPRHADWGPAMAAEAEHLPEGPARRRWALGCAVASYRTGPVLDGLKYAAALGLALAAMVLDQWIEDEGAGTCVVLVLLASLLGVLSPRRVLVSGAALGAVVAAVHVFGALTGIRPPYEIHPHPLVGGLRWLVFVAPALAAAAAGSRLSRLARPR